MKPDWKDAPEWANWIARDDDGQWRAFECEPSVDVAVGYHRPNGGKHVVITHWTESKERRK